MSRCRCTGVKDKVLAAYRAGITTVLLPSENAAQVEGLAPEVLSAVWFVFVDTTMQALEALFPLREAGALAAVGGMRSVTHGGTSSDPTNGDALAVRLHFAIDCGAHCSDGVPAPGAPREHGSESALCLPVTCLRGPALSELRSKL
jgi:hypothetical protein